jgi:chemotaxis signal transduction protein
MRTMVEFRICDVPYCLPVEATRAVRSTVGLIPLPSPATSVAGLLPGDPPLTVMSPFGGDGQQVVVVQVDEDTCGLLVDSVTGLRRIDETSVRPAPRGQERELISGSVSIDGHMVLLVDPSAVLRSPELEAE